MNTNAETLFARIPTGHKHPMYVPNSNTAFRKLVQEANLSGRDCIVNLGGGYFKVDVNDPEDVSMFNEYVEREQGRAREMWIKLNVMKKTISERRNEIERINSYSKRAESTEEFNQQIRWIQV